jgi:hypothetical protein
MFLYRRGSWWLAAAFLSKTCLWHSKKIHEVCVVICQAMAFMVLIASPSPYSSPAITYRTCYRLSRDAFACEIHCHHALLPTSIYSNFCGIWV